MRPRTIASAIFSAILLILLASCTDQPVDSAGEATPGVDPAVTASASATFTIDRENHTFANPRVAIDREATPMVLMIYPGIDDGEEHFYFEIQANPEALEHQSEHEQHLLHSERADSLVGIHLSDLTLQPSDLRILLKPLDNRAIEVQLEGRFLRYPGDALLPEGSAKVQARFIAQLVD